MKHSSFYLVVAKALGDCQAVELELKLYITHAFEITRRAVVDRLPFKFSGKDYEGASLVTLVKTFRKLSNNLDLIKRLDRFQAERNFLAHQAITDCSNEGGELDSWRTAGLHLRLSEIQREAQSLVDEIAREHSKLFVIDHNIPIPPEAI